MQINVDPAAVIELAAQKLAAMAMDSDDERVLSRASVLLESRLDKILTEEVQKRLTQKIDAVLEAEMAKVLDAKFQPTSIWGEPSGVPTTIRDQLYDRALKFWEVKVEPDRNKNGAYRETSYGGQPRYQVVYRTLMDDAFQDAIKKDVSRIVDAFRDALKIDTSKLIAAHIEKLIPSKKK